eukprot:symbB.v1.2.007682.t1/scaffold476.1/size199034/1
MLCLHVALLSGREATVEVSRYATGRELRCVVQRELKVGIAQLVKANGDILQERSVLEDAAVKNGDSLQAIVRLGLLASNCYSRAFAYVDAAGTVSTWGSPAYGGDPPPSVQEQLTDVYQVQHAAAFFQAGAFAALKGDGSVVTWGETAFGGKLAEQEKLQNVEAIQSTLYAFAALLSDGHVVTWGDANNGGDSGHVQPLLSEVVAIQATEKAFAAIRRDGVVIAWGDEHRGGDCSVVQPYLRQVSAIQASTSAFAAISDAGVVTWGDPACGGDSSCVKDQLKGVKQIQATCAAFAALTHHGLVVTWGDEDRGGDSSEASEHLHDVQHLQSTSAAFSALRRDGCVYAWGDVARGGDCSTVQEQLRDVQQLQATLSAFAALRRDGSVITWGDAVRGGDSSKVQSELRDVQQIQASGAAFAAIRSDGKVITWGDSVRGGDSTLVQEQLINVQQIQASTSAFAALRSDGVVVSWGAADCGGDCRKSGSEHFAQQLPSLSTFRARARVKCLLVGAQDQEFYSTWTETPQQVTGRQPPSAPVLMPVTVNYETEVLYRWNPLDTTALGPDCTFDSWFVQIREEGLAVWTSVTCGSSTTEECLIQNLKCDTNFEVAVAAICQEANLIGEYSTSSFKTQTGDKCLHPAGAPTMLMITEVGNSMVTITWTTGASMDCLFNAWLVQLRILGAANWESQGCETSSRENSTCTENCNISSTNSEWSNVTLATTSVLPSEAPGITPVVLSPDTVQLSWSAPMLNDCMFSGYQIQWALAAGGAEVWQNTCEAGLSSSCALGCDVTALPTQSLVVFRGRVLCVATEQNSEYNTTSEVLMPGRPMEAPSSVGASLISTYQAFISWSPGTLYDCVFQQWLLELQTDSNTDWEVAGACNITSPTATGCFLQGLPCGTQFRARVRGLCTIGSSSTVEMNFATPLVSGCRAKALAPSLVLASMPSTSTVDLTWQAGESLPNCSFLQWEVQTQPENQATFVATQGCNILTRNVTSCTVTGLQSSTNHSFRVREVCEESSLSSDWALSSSISTLLVPSQAPGNLMATDISSSSISLQWSAASLNDCRFQDYIVRWREGAGNWSTSSGCSVFSSSCESSCVASGLPSNREIQVEVMVQCVSSEADSPWTSVTMQTLPVPAPAVQNLQVTDIFTAGGTLSWNMAAFNDCVISSWLIDFREIFGAWSALSCAEPAVQTTPCGIRGLTCDTSYEVRVAVNCTDPVANGPFTTVSFTTLQGDLCLKQKPAPRFVTASSLGTSSMSVSWVDASDASNCSTSTWQVETRPANSDTWHMVCDQVERNVTSCIASGLQSNTGHSFRVREVCDDVSGSWGNTALTVSTDAKGAASTEVWASSPTVTSMLVQWNSPILFDCGFSSFELQWSVVAGTWQSAACAAVSMCDTSCRVASLPSNTQLTFRVRILCSDQALNSEWSNGSFPMSTLPRPSDVVLSSAVVISHDMANLTWERPTTNDCVLQGYQVELYDGAWRANPTGCVALNEETTDCTLTNLACDTEFQARVTTVCSDTLANSAASSSPSTFRTTAGAECLKRALLPRGLLLMPSSVSTMSFIWEAGDANDCTFASWDVQLNTLDGQIAASCQSLSHGTTSCSFTDLAENTSYVAVVQETCSQPLLSSPLAESSPASTLSVVVPSVQLQLPFPGETLAIRPTELTVMYDVDVELSSGNIVVRMDRVLPCTLRPNRASEFFALAEEQYGGSHKALVAKLLELSQRLCIRNSKDKAIICKGRKGYGLAIFVFTYDQRIPTSLWDHHTVLCRGLTVITCLPEHLNDLEDGASLELGILDAATKSTEIPLEIAECMPKFFESDPATVQGLKCFSADELRLEAVLEKVDGSLGLLHPARDPKTLEIVDGLPLISSKSVGFSEDIVQVRTMLEEKHPNFRLPKGVTALIVEVVRPEVQVCVPYSYQGFRMLAVMKDGAWLSEDAVDDMAKELGMERPKRMNLAALRPGGYGDGEEPSLADVIAKAEAYVMSDNPHELEEGWVVVMRNGLRLKVHTEVWNMLHAWWSNRITLKTVLPLLEDARINQVPFDNIRECLCGPAATAKRHQNADALKALLEQLRPIYEEP